MDYCDLFRPLFSYATHLTLALERRPGAVSENQVKLDLAQIIRGVRAAAGGDAHFEYAWFAAACWLKEVLLKYPETRATAKSVPLADNYEAEFYQRLNRLLLAARNRLIERELVRLYRQCLDLGFEGYYARPGFASDRERYLACCREVLAEPMGRNAKHAEPSGVGTEANLPPDNKGRLEGPGLFLRTAGWIIPPLLPVALYFLFADRLSQLCRGILE